MLRGIARRTHSRYDAILAGIPVAFLVAWVSAAVTGVPLEGTLLGASVIGALAMLEGIYRNPPSAPET